MCIFISIKLFFHTSVLQFLRALALHECFHKLLSGFFSFAFSLRPFLFVWLVSLVCFFFLSRFVFALSLLSSQRCWAIFQAAWFSLIWSIIIFHFDGGTAQTHALKKWKQTQEDIAMCSKGMRWDEMEWNGTIYRIYRKSAIMIIILSANESKSNIARKFILMIDAFEVVATAATAATAKDAAEISSQCIFNMR